jgi:hypothetical protein
MVDSVPITLNGKDYHLRFEQEDVMACESELRMGYIHFFRVEDNKAVTLSLMLCRTLIHHGLKNKDKKGELEYTFSQNEIGAKEAGELIQEHIRAGGSLMDIWGGCYDAFVQGWFPKPKPGDEKKEKSEPSDSKNSPGTG